MRYFQFVLLCSLLVILGGCATVSPPLGVRYPHAGASDAEVCRDLVTFPQDLRSFAEQAGKETPLISPLNQQQAAESYARDFFAPWRRQKSLHTLKDVFYFVNSHPNGRQGYGENMRPFALQAWQTLVENSNMARFPACNTHGITVRNTALRAMPTHKPFYKSPELAGEGYPFDYFSHAALWVGSPVYISHVSSDGLWVFVETQRISGWAPVEDIALVSDAFMASWQSVPLGAAVSDGVVLGVRKGVGSESLGSAVTAHIGTLLPLQGDDVLYPVRDADGNARIARAPLASAYVPSGTEGNRASAFSRPVQVFPVPMTAGNVAAIGNVMMGQPYGWGGFLENRDCSALLLDLFTPFGLWLPRNSAQQGRMGRVVSLEGLSASAKKTYIADNARPFTSLIWLPGHIVLYVGKHNNEPAIYHDMWGIGLQGRDGSKSRAVVGKVSVTSLSPGAELEMVSSPASILDRMNAVVFLGEK